MEASPLFTAEAFLCEFTGDLCSPKGGAAGQDRQRHASCL